MSSNINKFSVNLFLAFLSTVFCSGGDIYVSLQGTNNPPYANWPDAATNIQWAVNVATNNDTVWISNGWYVLTNKIIVNTNISIIGTCGVAVVDGQGAHRCFEISNVAATGVLANLTITGGFTNDNGGGVYMYNGSVRDCIFSNNVCWSNGGALYLAKRVDSIRRCTFINNRATKSGGGIYVPSTVSTVTIAGCTFYTNSAGSYGGGLYDNRATTLTTGCLFTCNYSSNKAGGAYVSGTMSGCAVVSNIADNGTVSSAGGGLECGASGLITNCFISNNIAYQNGGGIYAEVAGGTVKNCVIARNQSKYPNDGSNYGGGGVGGALNLYNCIIEENTALSYGGGVYFYDPNAGNSAPAGSAYNCLIRNNTAYAGGGVSKYTGYLIVSCCTIVSNYATSKAGGLYGHLTTSTDYYENCVIYSNLMSPGLVSNVTMRSTSTLVNCCFFPALSGPATNYSVNNITNYPQFVDPVSGNYRLDDNSPCVNAGIIAAWMADAVDLDGKRRVDKFSGRVDMGCYEYVRSGTMYNFR